jgi:phage-related protein (TIGR01555 family)
MASEGGEKLVQNRLQAMDMMKSSFHSILMDVDEDYVRDTLSFGGVSDVLYQFMMMTSACTGYPMTKLFGISPGGLNSTGDSDMYQYYDMVRAKQQTELLPIIERLVHIISEWQNIEEPKIEFNPLEQMTEKEQAELEEKKANTEHRKMETYQGYIDMGIMTPAMVEELEFGETLKEIAKKVGEPDSELPEVGE